jgi:hypothetical protein
VQGTFLAAYARRVLFWLVVVVACLVAVPALAADPRVEKDAQALQKKAIDEDFLNLDYAGAIKKLQTAIGKCGADKCGAPVKGALLRDLGAMQILNGNDGDGRGSFGQAIALDGTLELDPSYKNPQLEAAWADVKKKSGGGGTTPPPSGTGETPNPPAGGGSQPTGDFAHTPPTEALVRTPIPVYVEYSGSEALARVIVKYKGIGMTDWKPLELPKLDAGFGALIPCKDVTQGTMSYYVQGFNAANDPVATSGSRNKPFTVPVKATIAGSPAALPGQDPPKQCGELAGAECPPDFPGCNNKKDSGEDCDKDTQCKSGSCVGGKCAEKKAGGEDCSKDDECASGSCSDDKCTNAKKAEGEDCESSSDCESDSCSEGKCGAGTPSKGPKIWVGLGVSLDLFLMPGASDVCSLTTGQINSAGYSCLDNSNAGFPPNAEINGAIQKGHSDQVNGGFAHGPLHLMLAVDYALGSNMLAGIRGGYELLTSPGTTAFAPVHLEARFTYLIGKDAIHAKLAPMLFVGAGAGEFDAFVPVQVFLNPSPSNGTPQNPYAANAWLNAGPVFATLGGGARFLLSPKVAATGALKLEAAFGGSAGFLPGVAPELGIQFGF